MSPFEIVIIVVAVLIAVFLFLLFSVFIINKKFFGSRGDFSNIVSHTVPSDYPDILSTKITTKNENNVTLRGYFYKLKKDEKPKGLIIFFHGVGGGQNMYQAQIMYFVRNNYYVIAFDNEGSGMSDGKCIGSLGQCNNDARAVLKFVNSIDEFKSLPIYTLGHSLGGYASICSTLNNILPIKKSVSISGFHDLVSISMVRIPKGLFFLRPFIYLFGYIECGKTCNYTMSKAIKKNPHIKFFHLQGSNDDIVPNKISSDKLTKKTKNAKNFKMKIYEGAEHPHQAQSPKAIDINTLK